MIRFTIVFILFTVVSILSFVYFGSKNYQVIKDGGKAKSWSKHNQEKISNIFRWFFRIFAIGMFIYFIVPMTLDVPNLMKQEYQVVKGTPSTINKGPFGSWYFLQSVHIKGKTIKYFGYSPINPQIKYNFYYLPKSKFGVGITKIN